ncbi:MAG: hypothetical protein HKN89_10725, partial [Eudoraea sp.]|nr:hypothetical protein [Eudoraea sp.]
MKHFYTNSKTEKTYVRILTLAFFSIFTLTGFSQQPADPLDILNPLDNPSCTVTSGDCTSKDLELVGAFLDIDTAGCNSCDEGEQITATLYLSINNTTGSTRTSFAVFGNLTTTDPLGNITTEAISRCNGSLPPSTISTLPYGQITYTCGDALSLTDLILSWTDASPNSTCENHDCAAIAPKCGTVDEIVITPPLQSSAVAQCDGPVIDVDLSAQGGTAPFTYVWTGPNGFTATTEDLNDVEPGTYNVTVTDAQGCTTTASATQAECCQFLASCNLDPAEQVIEGCEASALPAPFTVPSEVFTVGPNPCGDLVLTHSDTPSGALCPDGISVVRSYTLFDDLNNNQILDAGEESATCVQNFKVVDTTEPTFTVPSDVTFQCDQDTEDLSLTGDVSDESDNCSIGLEATYTDIINASSCSTEYTITRTWTLTDACGNTSTSDQIITVEDTNSPTFNEALPANTVAAYDNIPAPEVLTASDMCDPNPQVALNESYIGDNTSTTYIIVRTWTASDCAGNETLHSQRIYVTENGDPIGLAINDISVNEADGTADFTVALTGEVSGGFTVDYLTNNGTAIAPGDFTAIAGSQFAFGGNHGEAKTISVSINDDSIVEDAENYEVNLTNLTTTEIGINKGIGNGTILDNDSATVSVSDLIVDEAVGNAQLVVVLSGDTEESFTVDFATADDSAIAGSDYTAVSGQVTFPENSPNGAVEVINIPITDDSLIEPTEQFVLDLTSISAIGTINIADNQGIVSITDNDGDGSGVSFDATSVTVNEGDGTATFTVRLSG